MPLFLCSLHSFSFLMWHEFLRILLLEGLGVARQSWWPTLCAINKCPGHTTRLYLHFHMSMTVTISKQCQWQWLFPRCYNELLSDKGLLGAQTAASGAIIALTPRYVLYSYFLPEFTTCSFASCLYICIRCHNFKDYVSVGGTLIYPSSAIIPAAILYHLTQQWTQTNSAHLHTNLPSPCPCQFSSSSKMHCWPSSL